jgi:hypothetical protein
MRDETNGQRFRLSNLYINAGSLEFRMVELESKCQYFMRIQLEHHHKTLIMYREHTVDCENISK